MNEEHYDIRLKTALEWAYRDPRGQFLLQHFMRIAGLLGVAGSEDAVRNEGRRSVAAQFLAECGDCRNGAAIVKTIFNTLIDIDQEPEEAGDAEESLADTILEHS